MVKYSEDRPNEAVDPMLLSWPKFEAKECCPGPVGLTKDDWRMNRIFNVAEGIRRQEGDFIPNSIEF